MKPEQTEHTGVEILLDRLHRILETEPVSTQYFRGGTIRFIYAAETYCPITLVARFATGRRFDLDEDSTYAAGRLVGLSDTDIGFLVDAAATEHPFPWRDELVECCELVEVSEQDELLGEPEPGEAGYAVTVLPRRLASANGRQKAESGPPS